jgi:hypothetical protein
MTGMALAQQGKQPMSKGKAKAGKGGGAGGGPSTKAGSSQCTPRARVVALVTEEDAVQAEPPLAAEAANGAQQTEPEPAGGGNTKKDKERQRKERQRRRKMDEAREALQGAIGWRRLREA